MSPLTIGMMLLICAVYGITVIYGIEYSDHKNELFGLNETKMLKGLFCILILLVHVPDPYKNKIQDILGSFAYIGVTFFFMTSSFGLKWSIKSKKNYLGSFWMKRLPSILIPALLCCIVGTLMTIVSGGKWKIVDFINIDDWVKLLLLFYLVFWCAYCIPSKFLKRDIPDTVKDTFICFIIVAFSLIDRLTPFKITLIWPAESWGFAYGILLANCFSWYKQFSNKQWMKKSLLFVIMSGLFGILYLKLKEFPFIGDYCLKIILGAVLLVLLLQITRKVSIGNKALGCLGGISFEIYLIHGSVFWMFKRFGIIDDSGCYILTCMIISIFSAAIINSGSRILIKGFKSLA